MKRTVARRRRILASTAASAVAVYVVLDVVAQLLPPHYSVLHQPESDLGVGPYSYVMNVNFVIRGIGAGAVAALIGTAPTTRRQKAGVWLVATWGICSALLAVFHTDVASSSVAAVQPTIHGAVHLTLAFVGFVAAAVGVALIGGRLFRRPRTVRVLASIAIAALVVFLVAITVTNLFGLFERLYIAAVLLWTVGAAMTLDGERQVP